MISLFKKLQKEEKLKQAGSLLDLGSGVGNVAEPFFKAGYNVTLVDMNAEMLEKATASFQTIKLAGFKTIVGNIEDFAFDNTYDGIIMSNVLPFQKEKANVERIVRRAYDQLNPGGFLYFTVFGTKDAWAVEHKDTMSFYEKEEALSLLPSAPYYLSEDYGTGAMMKGGAKLWHIFALLYIKP